MLRDIYLPPSSNKILTNGSNKCRFLLELLLELIIPRDSALKMSQEP